VGAGVFVSMRPAPSIEYSTVGSHPSGIIVMRLAPDSAIVLPDSVFQYEVVRPRLFDLHSSFPRPPSDVDFIFCRPYWPMLRVFSTQQFSRYSLPSPPPAPSAGVI